MKHTWGFYFLGIIYLILNIFLNSISADPNVGSKKNLSSPFVKPDVTTIRDPKFFEKKLTIGWFELQPYYQLIKSDSGLERLTGLDAELIKAIAKVAGYVADYRFVYWNEQLKHLKMGTQDFAGSATITKDREKFVYFSEPYRNEENSFYIRKNTKFKCSFKHRDMQTFVGCLKANSMKIAFLDGMVFASDEINHFLSDPENFKYLVRTKNVYESIDLLLRGIVDGFLDDRVASSIAIQDTKNFDKIKEIYLGISVPIHLMISKKKGCESVVQKLNQAIQQIKKDGTYSRILNDYLLPVLISQTIESPWFFILEISAIIALGISSLLIAYRERLNLYGTFIIAFSSMSGGIIRDLLVNRPRLGIMLSPVYIMGILSLIFIGFLVVGIKNLCIYYHVFFKINVFKKTEKRKISTIIDWIIEILDACGLAAYTVTGVVVALISELDPLYLWGPIMAVLTTTGGMVIRDMILGRQDLRTLRRDFYGEIAIIWGLILSLGLSYTTEIMSPDTMFYWVVFVVTGNFITRMIVKFFGFKGVIFH